MKNIEISADVYDKLGRLLESFDDTPNTVIERLIEHFNNTKKSQSVAKSSKKNSKDYTKYNFNNHFKLAKNRLVLEVVRQFIRDNEGISFQRLEIKFPKILQGSFGVFDKFEKGCKSFIEKDKKLQRFFTKQEELIQLSDARIAICSQWGKGIIDNIDGFIKQAEKLGFTITKIPN